MNLFQADHEVLKRKLFTLRKGYRPSISILCPRPILLAAMGAPGARGLSGALVACMGDGWAGAALMVMTEGRRRYLALLCYIDEGVRVDG